MGKKFANRLALLSFSVVVIRSLIHQSDFSGCIQTALVCLGLFYVAGYFLGDLAQRLIEEHVEAEEANLFAEIATTTTE